MKFLRIFSLTRKSCKKDAMKVFFDMLRDYADKLNSSPPAPPPSLAPPHEIYESINRLVRISQKFPVD